MSFDMSNQNNNGLLRFRSAPTSVLQNLTNDIEKIRDLNDGLSSRFSHGFQDLQKEVDNKPDLVNGYSLNSQIPPHYPRQSTSPASFDSTSSYNRVVSSSSMGMDNLGHQTKMGSGLLRQNSSPAGLFTHLTPQNGYGGMRATVGNYRNVGGDNGELSPSSSRLKGQMGFSSGVTPLGMLSRISEVEPETVEPSVINDTSDYFGSWEQESSHFAENFTGLKRELDDDENLFAGSQTREIGDHPNMLSHHLSLQKTCGEMAAVEKLLHFQDSVPCKVRAKRGCATHPRSIAERVRRTRISERMRKLQDLVPNMDKQTNTADMLDMAVDYIKDLQKQYKMLNDSQANCRCNAKSTPS